MYTPEQVEIIAYSLSQLKPCYPVLIEMIFFWVSVFPESKSYFLDAMITYSNDFDRLFHSLMDLIEQYAQLASN